MIEIKLTYRQWQATRYWGTPRHRFDYLERADIVGKQRVVTMPYPGWVSLQQILERETFTKWGKRRRDALAVEAGGTGSALTAISRALAKADGHPALRMESVLGYSAQRFVVWPADLPGRFWQLSPNVLNTTPVLLVPVYEPNAIAAVAGGRVRQQGVTSWRTERYESACLAWRGWSLDENEATGT